MVTFLKRIARSRWFHTFLGVLMLAVLIWFFGPLLGFGEMHPLDAEIARIIVIGILLVLWLVVNLLRELQASRKDKDLAESVVTAPDPDATASAEEVALLSERLREALHSLRRAKLGGRSRRRLYQLPWYMFIGPPGAGKTTALLNCGLTFPLAETQGPQALQGVGGTRHCDWWFTDQAVMIDTAGRYTTQDSQAAVDSAAWLGFLRLLKKYRRRQPLNGVLVAISLADLAELGDDERLAHARAVRKRVRELHDELGVRIPVYVLFTKTDLIAGFVEFFDSLGREEREQAWGMTFPLDNGSEEGGAVAHFGAEFDLLLARLNDRMLERVHQEPDVQRRRRIYGFPQQIASLRDVANEFLGEIFRPSRLEARPLLRGVYFTSGTQDGTPIDRLLGVMAGQFGLPRQAVGAFSGAGRSYFLARLVREVVFGEAGLVSLDPKVERRARWTSRAAYAACALLLVLLTAGWTRSYFGNVGMIDEVHAESERYNAQIAELAKRGAADADLPSVLPALLTLRTIRGGYEDREAATPIGLTLGLYQGNKLTSASIDAYGRALNNLLLPRLLARLEAQMAANPDKPDFLYEALKVYLILGRQGPLDRDLVAQWFDADFAAGFPGDDNQPVREALGAHIDALLEHPLAAIPLNDALVAQVRAILTREPLAEYSYNRIMRSSRVKSLPEWTVADNGGPGAGRVFQLRSGHPLASGVAGIFTRNGYHSVFLPLLPTVTQDISEDSWVLARPKKGGVAGAVSELSQLRHDVIGLYLNDYTRHWDMLLADIAIKPFATLADGLDELNLLAAPDSPLRDLLRGIDTQTQLSKQAAAGQAEGKVEAKAASVGKKLAGFGALQARTGLTIKENELANILGEAFGTTPDGKPVDPATRVDEHFRQVHDFVTGREGQPSPLEGAILKIQALYQNFNQVANAPNQGQALLGVVSGGGGAGAAAGGGGGAAAQLQALSKDMPKPIAAMLQSVSQSSSAVTASGASQELSDAWHANVLPRCAVLNRYPFVDSPIDVPLDDFTSLFGPGGTIDHFFDQYLKPFVDTTQSPWRWQSADHTKLGLSDDSLAAFEHAAQIRDSLFPAGGTQLLVKFQLVPASLDPSLAQVTIDVAGQSMTSNHGPTESTWFTWPGAGGKTLTRVTITPATGKSTVVEKDGPWALLRMLDAGHLTPGGQPDKLHLSFGSPATGTAAFDLNASSVRNPFTMATLRSFKCPQKL
jgi:type VI secretion system protein ImpL